MLNVINALSRVKAETPEKARLPAPPRHREDEIGLMVDIINRHLETIDSTLAQLREAEATMKNYSSELEHEVKDRTREISEKNEALKRGNKALVKAKEDAVKRARARADFLASMSHEIRTPLNGVLGMLSLARENEPVPEQHSRLEVAQNAGQSLLGLLNDILDISKVEAGKLNLEEIPFSVRKLAEECATLHAQQARRKNIDVVADIDPQLPEMFIGDPTRTRQILNNLLNNAIKFTEQGSVRLLVTRSDHKVRFDIVDTGIGMSQEGLDRIFSPFMRLLLVEDNQVNQLVASGMLKRLGHEVVLASDGQQALDTLEADDRIDMILMDCQMPVLDGYETTRIIRQTPQWRTLPMIAVSSAGSWFLN